MTASSHPRASSPLDYFSLRENRIYVILGALLTACSLSVIWLIKFPPLQDFPYHLVRIHMLLRYGDEELGLAERATLSLFPTPYIFADYLSLIFGQVFSLLTTGKLVLSVYIILMAYSVFYLADALHQKYTPFALFGFLFIFNYFFNMGLMSFMFSIPFFLLAFGYWWKYRTALTPARLATLSLLITGVYLSHPFSFCFLFLVLTCLSIYFYDGKAKILSGLLSFLPPVILLAIAMNRDMPASEVSHHLGLFFLDPANKVSMAIGGELPYFTSFKPKYEAVIVGVAALIVFAALIYQLTVSFRNKERGGLLLAATLLFATYLCLPDDLLLPNISLVANRALIFCALILILIPMAPARPVYRLGIALTAAMLALAQLGLMFFSYRAVNTEYADIYAAFAHIPEHGRLAYWSNWSLSKRGHIYPIAHFNGYYYVERAGSEIPTLTAFAGPLRALQFKDQSNRTRPLAQILSAGCRSAAKGGSVVLLSLHEPTPTRTLTEESGCALSFSLGPVTVYRAMPDSVSSAIRDKAAGQPIDFSTHRYYKEGFDEEHDYLVLYGPQKDADALRRTGCYELLFTRNRAHAFKHATGCKQLTLDSGQTPG